MRLGFFIMLGGACAFITAGCSSTPLVVTPSGGTPGTAMLNQLHTITTLASTVDPVNGDQNPYGLAVAPASAGQVAAGDLIVCNFNDAANVQGNGTTIVGLAPVAGAAPFRIAQDARLKGCDALSIDPATGNIWTANLQANDVAIFSPGGAFLEKSPYSVNLPWGMIEAGHAGATVFFQSNSADGTIDRLTAVNGVPAAQTQIAQGFSVNHGVPGTVLAPAGLTYDPSLDTLYVVDGNADRVVALGHASQIAANGVVVTGSGFSGPSAANASVIASGGAIDDPISSALLPNGDVVIGDADPNGANVLVEISPTLGIVATKNVDSGPSGALFGVAVSGTNASNVQIFFNDDNTNTVNALSR
jgi:hypothetical protein